MNKQDSMHSSGVRYHNLGLWGYDMVNDMGWNLMSLTTIIKFLGHEQVSISRMFRHAIYRLYIITSFFNLLVYMNNMRSILPHTLCSRVQGFKKTGHWKARLMST